VDPGCYDTFAMSRPPSISVIVPTCDRSEQTRRCLEALAVQTRPPAEIVVVDDASADETPSMLESFAADHPAAGLIALRNATNLGANASRNRGVRAATGEILAFLDSDCIAEPAWLEELTPAFDAPDVAAVPGLVLDPDPRNVYDLAFRGTHRVVGPGPARRIVAGNLAIRRGPLMASMWYEDAERPPLSGEGRPDVSFSGACDEEWLFLELCDAGWRILARPSARVLHVHHYDRRSFFRQAYHGGRAAAELVHRRGLRHRMDMVPFMLAYATLCVAAILVPWLGWWPLLVPAAFGAVAIAAITYNDLHLKGKTVAETLQSFPVLLAYYHVRLAGYARRTVALALRRPPAAQAPPVASEE
jgi:glycosyltransferase involved in cell wall biosynthesis